MDFLLEIRVVEPCARLRKGVEQRKQGKLGTDIEEGLQHQVSVVRLDIHEELNVVVRDTDFKSLTDTRIFRAIVEQLNHCKPKRIT
jgi:hypothetical protein